MIFRSNDALAGLCANSDELVGDMVEVYGQRAAGVARENARAAALAGDLAKARSWLRIVDLVQRRVRPQPTQPAIELQS